MGNSLSGSVALLPELFGVYAASLKPYLTESWQLELDMSSDKKGVCNKIIVTFPHKFLPLRCLRFLTFQMSVSVLVMSLWVCVCARAPMCIIYVRVCSHDVEVCAVNHHVDNSAIAISTHRSKIHSVHYLAKIIKVENISTMASSERRSTTLHKRD